MYQQQLRRPNNSYLSEDTVASLVTAPGGAVSIIRISGPEAFIFYARLCPGSELLQSKPRTFRLCELHSLSNLPLDRALAVGFVGPDSFTGENVVELHLHGGSYVAARVLEELSLVGARQALPGEFSFRAVRNGKFSLSQAQALSDLISAKNDSALSLALEKMSGPENRLLKETAELIRRLATLAEAGIDFSDQNIDEVSLPKLKTQLEPVTNRLHTLAMSYQRGSRIQEGVRIAVMGLPNAGKSSFFNFLLGEDRSIVSDIPGTTRDIIREQITLREKGESVTLRLEDTAGLRKTSDPIEQMGVERALKAGCDSDLVLWVVDPISDFDAAREFWLSLAIPVEKTLGIISKLDLIDSKRVAQMSLALSELGISRSVALSAVSGAGSSPFVSELIHFAQKWTHRASGEIVLTRLDHAQAVLSAHADLRRALGAEDSSLFAADLRHALNALALLIGETLPDDILGRIFSEFCIGK